MERFQAIPRGNHGGTLPEGGEGRFCVTDGHSSGRGLVLLAAKNGSVFTPRHKLSWQIHAAGRHIASYLKSVDDELDSGSSVGEAVQNTGQIKSVMRRLTASAHLHGYTDGAAYLKKTVPALYGAKVQKYADKRSGQVDRWMRAHTRRSLKSNPDGEFVLSAERGHRAAEYEAAEAYFDGLQASIAGSGIGKMWITSGGNSCPQCLDNESTGIIDADDDFDGDDTPPIHVNCGCSIGLIR